MRTIHMFLNMWASLFLYIAALLLIFLIFGFFGITPTPEDKTILLTILTVIFASIGWVARHVFLQIEKRAKLEILELLSDGQPRTSEEITSVMKFKGLAFHVYEPKDAILDLLYAKHLRLLDGKYTMPQENLYSEEVAQKNRNKHKLGTKKK